MTLPRPLLLLARTAFAVYILLTVGYCLLTYIPFTYQQVNLGGLLPWLTTFTRLHAYLFFAAWAVALLTIVPDLRRGPARPLAFAFAGAGLAGGIALLLHPLLSRLSNDRSSLYWFLVFLLPCFWLAAIDFIGHRRELRWSDGPPESDARIFGAAWQAALFVAFTYAAVVFVRSLMAGRERFPARAWGAALLWSVTSHLLLFLVAFVLLALVAALAALAGEKRHSRLQLLGGALAAVAAAWFVLRTVVFLPISFTGARASLIALVSALALVAYALGTNVRLVRSADGPMPSGLTLLFMPFRFLENARWPLRLGFLAAVVLVTAWLQARATVFDWEFLFQKLIVVAYWGVAFASFYALAARARRRSPWLMYGVALAVLAAYVTLANLEPRQPVGEIRASPVAATLDSYADYDVSFRTVDDLFAPSQAGSRQGGSFYSFLADNTNIPHSRPVAPVDIRLVQNWTAATVPQPNIFIFVIDSLRRDYLAPYDPDVDFTPNIAAFARDSVLFRDAFTHYGGTGLSEPAIWVGGLMLHKQYVTPFAPMNALQKLLQHENYQEWVSRDAILETVLGPSPGAGDLDADSSTMNYDFCTTLDEVTTRLRERHDPQPLFIYTQPQNIHVSVISREGRSTLPGASYPPGFDPPYASRVRRMDGCFGNFIAFLKQQGIYDNSIIILTSDHGDSLGERGRWGHAYALFPEIVRIPLIIHLPASLRSQVVWDADNTAFVSDITPSLYYLLGQRPVERNGIYGRPLFTSTLEEQKDYQAGSYLIASSYGPVYGELSGDGQDLYVVDGVNYKDYYFRVDSGRQLPISDDFRTRQRALIRDQITAIGRFYGLR
jgi:glucan phosphoethanolaminetransferase (alkaline phosphatase superfamily)